LLRQRLSGHLDAAGTLEPGKGRVDLGVGATRSGLAANLTAKYRLNKQWSAFANGFAEKSWDQPWNKMNVGGLAGIRFDF